MDIYKANLAGLLGLCGALFVAQRQTAPKSATTDGKKTTESKNGKKTSGPASKVVDGSDPVQWAFLVVYSLVMGADWLQVRP